MNLYQVSLMLFFLCFLIAFVSASSNPTFTDDVSINCGSRGTSAASNKREWHGDVQLKFSSLLRIKGSSSTSSVIHKLTSDNDPVPYKTARLSRSRFSYAFHVSSGEKILRLHFNPTVYKGFKGFKDLFAVEAGPFTLLSNFSASLTADALGVNSFVKEYCINIKENKKLDIVFIPTSSQSLETYAFINGIEIISVPAGLSYFHGGDIGVQEVGKSLVYADHSTVLEIIRRLNVKQDSFSSGDDADDLFRMRETVPERKPGKLNYITWKVPVDVGFRYLVRLHLSKVGFELAKMGRIIFKICINEAIVGSDTDMVGETSDENNFPLYRDFMVMMQGSKVKGKRNLLICLQSNDEFLDGHRPLKGFEIMKLSNPDYSLASLNPLPKAQDSSYMSIRNFLQVFHYKNAIATVAVPILALLNIIVYALREIWEASVIEEENKPSAKAERFCRQFSLAEIKLATKNFSNEHLIGKGGFGKVYKGIIDNGRETVAIKRQKLDSNQGAREFLTEIETLTELRHVNLVSLIGYCNEQWEMILVYEYMSCGTLSDHLYKLVRNDDNSPSLTWNERLNICIGAGRGLDYLHTGHSLIHRDVKASNILLNESFTAKVSDFGLAKHLSTSKLESHVSTRVKGTFGYLDPHYLATGKLTMKSDTYAFGVVLLEVLSGRRAVNTGVGADKRILTKWARDNIRKGTAGEIVSSNLRGEISEDSLMTYVEIAERCLDDEPKKRPTMAQVVLQLELALELQDNSKSHVPNRITTNDLVDDTKPFNDDNTDLPVSKLQLTMASTDAPPVRQDNVVGLEDTAEKIIGYLREDTQQLDVIPVIGMPGLGKTTLAGKVFHDPRIQHQFSTRVWIYVSQEFTKKNVFLSILKEFTMLSNNMFRKSEQELAKLVTEYLARRKFLIVMDDVRTPDDWDKLQVALPKGNKLGKILITSRNYEVGRHAARNRIPHKLRFLNQDESWLLLYLEVFGEAECPPKLEGLVRVISRQCVGLPLAVVVVGGILTKEFSSLDDMGAIEKAWKKVSQRVQTYLYEEPEERLQNIISLSYHKLPYHLKPCFLYFGMFPEDFEIPVWKLIRLWIAEEFIQQQWGFSQEETAENYLEDLISRNLIRIDKMSPDGRVKTCRIHDMLRDFCKIEAGNESENFLQEMKSSSYGGFEPPVDNIYDYRRLCIHSNVLDFLSLKPNCPHVHSFACFSKEEINLTSENISSIPDAFKLLRVLDVEPLKFTKIPSDIYHLVHLRYIALSFTSGVLPPDFSELLNLQTLKVDTTSRTLAIKADISKMIQLRHLKTNASATLLKPDKSNKEGEKLQTLGMISPQSCTDDVLDRVCNLKKLGIRGHLALLMEGETGSFDCLGKLENLEKLKLLNDAFPRPTSDGKLRILPPPYKFPPKLRILTLSDTYLDWSHMSVLALLDNLEVLKLKEKAFMGKYWVAVDGGFRHLEVLHIGRTDLVSWSASSHHFPRLRCLELKNCEELRSIPSGLADIPTFQVLDLHRTNLAAASAKSIEAKKKQQEGPNAKITGFKLSMTQ